MVAEDEDFKKGDVAILRGTRLRSQELGVLAALGIVSVPVYRKPVVAIIPTGDEVVAVEKTPPPGCIRDVNTHTLAGLVTGAGGVPVLFDLVPDDRMALRNVMAKALATCDMVLLSGGSSVGARDFTIAAMEDLADARILVHGIGMRPGKPTILAKVGGKAVWGLPGQVASAMVVFMMIVRPFVEHVAGQASVLTRPRHRVTARLWRNVPSVQGRIDYVRVKLVEKEGTLWAQPIFGKSGLLNTMTWADGVIEIDADTEGINAGEPVGVVLF
jgi:molybdopterin molybdotransferase